MHRLALRHEVLNGRELFREVLARDKIWNGSCSARAIASEKGRRRRRTLLDRKWFEEFFRADDRRDFFCEARV